MQIEATTSGRRWTVTVERVGTAFRLTVDGRSRLVDVTHVDRSALSLLFLDEPGSSYEVGIEEGSPGELAIALRGVVVPVTIDAGLSQVARRARRSPVDQHDGAEGPQRIVAPMAGRVVRLLVAPGDSVEPRQALIVVEAMKMENELRSPKGGRVREVHVTDGASVEAGAILLVIE